MQGFYSLCLGSLNFGRQLSTMSAARMFRGNRLAFIALDELRCSCREEGGICMEHADRYAGRPVAFLLRYVSARATCHAVILLAVLAAVGCSVGAQYGVKI